jgi:hypothetical protein
MERLRAVVAADGAERPMIGGGASWLLSILPLPMGPTKPFSNRCEAVRK